MSVNGFVLLELFGYYFSQQLKESIIEIGKRSKVIRVNLNDFTTLITKQWLNMGEYYVAIPIIFSIMKGWNDTVSIRDFDKYLKVKIY
jgi:hypothetical protein